MVHAGLDLLIAEIKDTDPEAETVPINCSTVELIQQIFSSSESAIDLLNDLLQYEQIDAGGYPHHTRLIPVFVCLYAYESPCIRDTQTGAELVWCGWISAQKAGLG